MLDRNLNQNDRRLAAALAALVLFSIFFVALIFPIGCGGGGGGGSSSGGDTSSSSSTSSGSTSSSSGGIDTGIQGKVLGVDSVIIEGVGISVDGITKTSTDIYGNYSVNYLTAGNHEVKASKNGYQDETKMVTVQNSITTVDFILKIASSSSSSSSGSTSSSSSSSGSSSGSSSSSSSSSSGSTSSSSSSSSSSGGGTVEFSWAWRANVTSPGGLCATESEIAVAKTSENKIARFDLNGNLLGEVSDPDFDGIISVATDGNFYFVLSSNNRAIVKFSSSWAKLGKWSFLYEPRAISAKSNRIAILKSKTGTDGWVEVYDFNGTKVVNEWQIQGAATPRGITLTPSVSSVVVADTDNHRILQFSVAGIYEGTFGSYGLGNGAFEFCYPKGVAIDSNANIYVVDGDVNARFSVYGSDFSLRGRYQGSLGTGDGQFRSPIGIDCLPDGTRVFVSNSIGANTQGYTKKP